VDGCVVKFLPDKANCVISPYHCQLPDVCPEFEYSGELVFSIHHPSDDLRLFEDGFLDTVRWLEAGAPSREKEREQAFPPDACGFARLWSEGWRVMRDIIFGQPNVASSSPSAGGGPKKNKKD